MPRSSAGLVSNFSWVGAATLLLLVLPLKGHARSLTDVVDSIVDPPTDDDYADIEVPDFVDGRRLL
jgi:hypothetical protein